MIAAALLIASAAAFATGAAIERHTASSQSEPALHHAEAGSPGENPAGGEPGASREGPAAHAAEQNSEDLLGINPEATVLVVIAVVVSLLLGRADPHRALAAAGGRGHAGHAGVHRAGHP